MSASFARNCPAHVVAATSGSARWQAAPRRIDARSHCYRRHDGATSLAGDARTLARQGMSAFERRGRRVHHSRRRREADPRYATRLWQRGLSITTLTDSKMRGQFLMDVAENPNDTEEAAWHLLAMARTEGLGKARPQMIKWPRPAAREERLKRRFATATRSRSVRRAIATDGGAGDRFTLLYMGLLAEAAGQPRCRRTGSRGRWRMPSVRRPYALAKVHQSREGPMCCVWAPHVRLAVLAAFSGYPRFLLVLRQVEAARHASGGDGR